MVPCYSSALVTLLACVAMLLPSSSLQVATLQALHQFTLLKDWVRARRREVCGKMNVRVLSMCLFWLRRLAISGSAWHPRALWALIRPPTVQLAEVRLPCFAPEFS